MMMISKHAKVESFMLQRDKSQSLTTSTRNKHNRCLLTEGHEVIASRHKSVSLPHMWTRLLLLGKSWCCVHQFVLSFIFIWHTNTHLLQHLLSGVEFIPVLVQTQVQVSNLLSLCLHLVSQHTHLHETNCYSFTILTYMCIRQFSLSGNTSLII